MMPTTHQLKLLRLLAAYEQSQGAPTTVLDALREEEFFDARWKPTDIAIAALRQLTDRHEETKHAD